MNIGGFLKDRCELFLFDFMDVPLENPDQWGRGKFHYEIIKKPSIYKNIPRYYRRFGRKKDEFEEFIKQHLQKNVDFVLITSGMTYWYLGVKEVIETVRRLLPRAKIVVGGVYATIMPEHCRKLGADLVVEDSNLKKLTQFLGLVDNPLIDNFSPIYDMFYTIRNNKPKFLPMKISDGCPFNCTYCASKLFASTFKVKPLEMVKKEFDSIAELGIENIAFYDDALLYEKEKNFYPFLDYVINSVKSKGKDSFSFHTPNGLGVKFLDEETIKMMIKAGFKTFYLGFENICTDWHKRTGNKLTIDDFEKCIRYLKHFKIQPTNITAYIMVGHPLQSYEEVLESIQFIAKFRIRISLAEYSPIPRTKDGELAGKNIDINEPLTHSKTFFPIFLWGNEKIQELKQLVKNHNRTLN